MILAGNLLFHAFSICGSGRSVGGVKLDQNIDDLLQMGVPVTFQ